MRVLLATDGSVEADLAEAVVNKLPLGVPEIVVTTVIHGHPLSMGPPGFPNDGSESALQRLQEDIARRTTEHVSSRLSALGATAYPLVLQGEVAGELLSAVEREGIDLVASGSRMAGTLKAFFLGSVSRKLALYSPCSVLVAHPSRTRGAIGAVERIHSKKRLDVLLAYDGSAGSELALTALLSSPAGKFESLLVVTVGTGGRGESASGMDLAERAADKLSRIAGSVETQFASGRPSLAIRRIAAERNVDLIMLGANRHGPVERLMVGSCANETVASAPCSVLIVRRGLHFE